jgi:Contractile injection system tube protein
MALKKAKFQRLNQYFGVEKEIDVQFNPTEYTLNKGVQIAEIPIPGLDMPILQFVRGQTETLSLDLFFDVTESGTGENNFVGVTVKTDEFYKLIKIDPATHAPPVCRFCWGEFWFAGNRIMGMECVVESVRQRFTLFNPDGYPLRAVLTVSLKEYKTLEDQINETPFSSPDRTHSWVVRRGDTLGRIAAAKYDDPRLWRAIADENKILDPLDLKPGVILKIPSIR